MWHIRKSSAQSVPEPLSYLEDLDISRRPVPDNFKQTFPPMQCWPYLASADYSAQNRLAIFVWFGLLQVDTIHICQSYAIGTAWYLSANMSYESSNDGYQTFLCWLIYFQNRSVHFLTCPLIGWQYNCHVRKWPSSSGNYKRNNRQSTLVFFSIQSLLSVW